MEYQIEGGEERYRCCLSPWRSCGDSVVAPFAASPRKLGKHHALRYTSGNAIRFRKRSWSVFPSWTSRVRVPSPAPCFWWVTRHAVSPSAVPLHHRETASPAPATRPQAPVRRAPVAPTCQGRRRGVSRPLFARPPGMFDVGPAARPSRAPPAADCSRGSGETNVTTMKA